MLYILFCARYYIIARTNSFDPLAFSFQWNAILFLLLATEKKLWTSSFKISFFSAVYIMKKRKILLTRTYLISTPILPHSVDIGQFILSLFEQIISIFWSTNNHIFDLVFSTLMVKTSCET